LTFVDSRKKKKRQLRMSSSTVDCPGVSVPPPSSSLVKMDYYQSASDVIVTLFLKAQSKDDFDIKFTPESFRVGAQRPDGTYYHREVILAGKINPDQSAFKVLSTKIEVRLRKAYGGHWSSLEAVKSESDKDCTKPSYPTSSKKKFDWDKMEKEIEKQEKEDPDADVNSLFSRIFESGDDNTRKAMMKSMQESGGTVLSTNWEEVGKKKVEISPPDGMEYKKWE